MVDWLVAEPVETLDDARRFYRSLGGNASNVSVGLSRLGTPSTLIAKIGRDLHGRYLADILAGEGVEIKYLAIDDSHHTAQCYVLTGPDGDHTFYNWPQPHAADMLTIDDLSYEALIGVEVLHAAGISLILEPRRSTVLRTMETAADNGLVVSFDACFPSGKSAEAKHPVEQAMGLAHILKVNKRELVLWSGGQPDSSVDEMADVLFSRYQPLAVAVTLGEQGSRIKTASGVVDCRPFTIPSVNGVGAGDGFIAGMLHALHRKLAGRVTIESVRDLSLPAWAEAGAYGNAVGALATRCLSASEGLPRDPEVQALIGGT